MLKLCFTSIWNRNAIHFFCRYGVLEVQKGNGLADLGQIKPELGSFQEIKI